MLSHGELMLIEKLKVKAGAVAVLNAPKQVLAGFKSLKPATALPPGAKARFDFVLLFARKSAELADAWKKLLPALKQDAILWVASPKKSSGIDTDLARMGGGWDAINNSAWQPVASASIDETWTGTRFKYAPNLKTERQERSTEEIHDMDGTLVVDKINRVIHPSRDLAAKLQSHPEARLFFDSLSFTNRKEYVLWIIEAKKPETRAARLTAAIEKLVSGRKNPSENRGR